MKTYEELAVGDTFTIVRKANGKTSAKFLRIKEIIPVTSLYYKGCEKEAPGTILGYHYKLEEFDGGEYITWALICKPNFKKFKAKYGKTESYYSDPKAAYEEVRESLLDQLLDLDTKYNKL